MPLVIPNLSDRKYQELLNEALARIPVHNPEWTNFNDSDPGVTLLQLFAFLTENLLYRSNQIPERNRHKFLTLLGVPLRPATPARGLVTISNERGPFVTVTLGGNLEVHAGEVPFRTAAGLDVLPVEGRVFYKRTAASPSPDLIAVYRDLYASFVQPGATLDFTTYETVPLPNTALPGRGLDLADAVDGTLWIALLKRTVDAAESVDDVLDRIAGKTVSLGLVPAPAQEAASRILAPGQPPTRSSEILLEFAVSAGGTLAANRKATYRTLDPRIDGDVFTDAAIVQLTLPPVDQMGLWTDVDPLEAGTGDFPPALEDTSLADRVAAWLRIRLAGAGQARLSLAWAGINCTRVSQRAHLAGELLPPGTGQPDQSATLAHAPVIDGTVQLTVTPLQGSPATWQQIDDLLAAGPEVPVADPRLPPGVKPPDPRPSQVFRLDAEAGTITFGDGLRGARPPFGATIHADYDMSVGRAGDVGPETINTGPSLPAGFKVRNPVRTWGGTDAESVREGERQIPRYLQHRDRLVTVDDFKTIVDRTPGIELGRVEVLPAFRTDLTPNAAGDAPGIVTVLVIPRLDPLHPNAPEPDRLFLNAICDYLEPRRLVTTEVRLTGPTYVDIWLSFGITPQPTATTAEVREAVKAALLAFLSPLPPPAAAAPAGATGPVPPQVGEPSGGWPLRKPVVAGELLAVASRVPGVQWVNEALLAQELAGVTNPANVAQINLQNLELPRVVGISVTPGGALALSQLRAQTLGAGTETGTRPLPMPVPAIPADCQCRCS